MLFEYMRESKKVELTIIRAEENKIQINKQGMEYRELVRI